MSLIQVLQITVKVLTTILQGVKGESGKSLSSKFGRNHEVSFVSVQALIFPNFELKRFPDAPYTPCTLLVL